MNKSRIEISLYTNTTDPPLVVSVDRKKKKGIRTGEWLAVTGQPSTEFTTDNYQNSKPAQSEHGGDYGFDPERDIVPDSPIEPLVVEKDDEGGDDAEEIHDRYHLLG